MGLEITLFTKTNQIIKSANCVDGWTYVFFILFSIFGDTAFCYLNYNSCFLSLLLIFVKREDDIPSALRWCLVIPCENALILNYRSR